jgi:cell fate (sporulation/competence/biofilm development) regulator YlbF (YheA/YmcA/DUF963 family)
MPTDTEATAILDKTRELCETILTQPGFQAMRRQINAFLADEQAKSQYQRVAEKGDLLQHKQQMGVPLDGDEIADFENERAILFKNPVAKAFLDAQEEMHRVQASVSQYVTKTFELGRVPVAEDFADGSCGPSCGCGH